MLIHTLCHNTQLCIRCDVGGMERPNGVATNPHTHHHSIASGTRPGKPAPPVAYQTPSSQVTAPYGSHDLPPAHRQQQQPHPAAYAAAPRPVPAQQPLQQAQQHRPPSNGLNSLVPDAVRKLFPSGCAGCGKWLGFDVTFVNAMGRQWHQFCFRCGLCMLTAPTQLQQQQQCLLVSCSTAPPLRTCTAKRMLLPASCPVTISSLGLTSPLMLMSCWVLQVCCLPAAHIRGYHLLNRRQRRATLSLRLP